MVAKLEKIYLQNIMVIGKRVSKSDIEWNRLDYFNWYSDSGIVMVLREFAIYGYVFDVAAHSNGNGPHT